MAGQTLEPVTLAQGLVSIPAGRVDLELWFSGGASPEVRKLRCVAPPVVLEFAQGRTVLGHTALGSAELPRELPYQAPLVLVEELLDHLHDLAVRVEAIAGDELWVKFAPGFQATIPSQATVTVDAATRGDPARPRLSRPFVVSVGGAGLSIRLPGSRWLKALASISLRGASLAPDGEVELRGHGAGALDRMVGAGLRHTSSHLSELVRRSPQFAKVRTFLAEDGRAEGEE